MNHLATDVIPHGWMFPIVKFCDAFELSWISQFVECFDEIIVTGIIEGGGRRKIVIESFKKFWFYENHH